MRISVIFATIFATLSVVALPLALRDSSEPSLSLRTDDPFSSTAVFYVRASTPAHNAAKAARAATHKAAGLVTQKTKAKVQVHEDRKAWKELKATKKAARVAKALANKDYKTHEMKIKKKAKVVFSPGASARLDSMGLHGKARKSAKKYHKSIMLPEIKKMGADKGIVISTAHTGGTVKTEVNHITAKFQTDGISMPSSWISKATGELKVGEKDMHHVLVKDNLKVPSAWSKALEASHARKMAAEQEEKDKLKKVRDAKAMAGESIRQTISPENKKAQREAAKAEKAARKKKPGAT